MQGPSPKLTDAEARAYAHLSAGKPAGIFAAVELTSELAGVLLKALDELADRRPPFADVLKIAGDAGADQIRREADDATAPLTVLERAEALGRRLDFHLLAGSNLEVAELARAYVELKRLAPLDTPFDAELEDTRDVVIVAAADLRNAVIEAGLTADHFGGRLEFLAGYLEALGEALDVHESA